ncbi:MAG: hypothetical protein AABZ80_06530 [Gemmatimonadota bacterium]
MSATSDEIRVTAKRPRRGFALPLAILALALITAAVAASSASTRAEIIANQAVRAQDRAYQLAEAGLQTFMSQRGLGLSCSNCVTNPGTSSADSEWTRVSLTGGYADVAAIRLRPYIADTMPALFFVKSRGVDTTLKMSGTGLTVYPERIVGQYATFRTASMKIVAAWVALGGVTKSGSTSAISGADECGVQDSVAGVTVPIGEYRTSGSTPAPIGKPAGVSTMSASALKALIGIDWNAIINNDAIPADNTIPTNGWPGSSWRVTRIKQASYTIPSDGNGILIADGNVTFPGSRDFDGIILVGGQILGTGSQPSSGVVYSGLNYLLPGAASPPASSTDDATIASSKSVRYNSCNVATALALLNNYFAWSNTWLDNVAIW